MSENVGGVLDRLTRSQGVRGAMVVDAEAGVAVAAELAAGVEEEALAALAGSLFNRTADAARSARFGEVRLLQLNGSEGRVLLAGAGALLVVAVTERDAQLGLVRIELEQAAEELS